MNRGAAILLLIVLGIAPACRESNVVGDVVRQYGLTETTRWHAEVLVAINRVNKVLGADEELRLVPGWASKSERSEGSVPVYVVNGTGLSDADKVFVPEGEQIILVNADSISDLPYIFHETGHGYTNATMTVGTENYLGLIFLHELGHIVLGHSGSYNALPIGRNEQLNLSDNAGKDTELAADKFAANRLKKSDPLDGFELNNALANIIWNYQAWKSLEHFGSEGVFAPDVYWDKGYSHPNISLRMLLMAHLVKPSDFMQEAVDGFFAARQRRPWIAILEPVETIEHMELVLKLQGHEVRRESVPGGERLVVTYPPTEEEFSVDLDPGDVESTIRNIADAAGLELP